MGGGVADVEDETLLPSPLTAHVGYQLVEVGYDVLLSVEPSCLDEPYRTACDVKVVR